MGWEQLRKERIDHGGAFAWFVECREHGQKFRPFCVSCGFAEDHNAEIWRELADEMGWLLGEPAGDVPLADRAWRNMRKRVN